MRRILLFMAVAIFAIGLLVAPVTAIAADIGPPTVLATPAALTVAENQATQITAIHDCGTPVALAGTGSPPTAATLSQSKYFVRDPERWLPAMGGGDKIAMRRSDDFLPAKPATATSEKPHATTGPLRR